MSGADFEFRYSSDCEYRLGTAPAMRLGLERLGRRSVPRAQAYARGRLGRYQTGDYLRSFFSIVRLHGASWVLYVANDDFKALLLEWGVSRRTRVAGTVTGRDARGRRRRISAGLTRQHGRGPAAPGYQALSRTLLSMSELLED